MNEIDHEQWNETMATKYDPDLFITKTGWIVRWVEKNRLDKTRLLLNAGPNDHVLDVGCGPGNLLVELPGKRVVGLDLSDALLAQAKKRTAGNPRIEVVKGNAEKLPFPDNSFDGVICSEVLEHVRSPETALREIHRVTKPGGRFILTLPNETMINLAKRFVLTFRLKRWIAGEYPMSDNMLEEWHVSEIHDEWVRGAIKGLFELKRSVSVPFFPISFHSIWELHAIKKA